MSQGDGTLNLGKYLKSLDHWTNCGLDHQGNKGEPFSFNYNEISADVHQVDALAQENVCSEELDPS